MRQQSGQIQNRLPKHNRSRALLMNSAEARNQALGEQHVKEREPNFPSQHSCISLPSWRKKALFQWESLNTQVMRQQASSSALASPEAQLEELQQHARPLPGHSSSPRFRYCSRNRTTLSGTKRLQHVFCCLHFCLHPGTVFAFSQQDKFVDSCLASDPV